MEKQTHYQNIPFKKTFILAEYFMYLLCGDNGFSLQI